MNGKIIPLQLEAYDSGGTRNYFITFSEKDINKSAPLP